MLEQAMRSGGYPAMAALSEDAFGMGWDESFEFGLGRLVAGLVALVESRGHREGGDQGASAGTRCSPEEGSAGGRI